jgi:hypothetical protein
LNQTPGIPDPRHPLILLLSLNSKRYIFKAEF